MAEPQYTPVEVEEGQRVVNYMMEKGLDNETIVKRFDEISEQYNKAQNLVGYKCPKWMGESLAALYPSNRENIKILDVAAGTGMAAFEMRKHGFVDIDGLEPSQKMLDEAKKDNLYGRYICDLLGENTLDIADNSYTVVTMVGMSSEIMKKLPVKALEELARVTKTGGHVMINNYDRNFKSDIIRTNLSDLESRGVWKLEEEQTMPKISHGVDGILQVYRVL
ncbi:methyltransferase-like protein 27 [Haliotis rubra]|uniref:methyltransferase-like protein 27 n=1 Tax=Haliotis rubra TaxID=36100 RepID=UPI001EE5D655|nr:methyltransferase-like protein 27 [Haliotis rubra]XP_046547436.1 methyltransferase-like protein 27 [Haliotis rubra]